MKTIAVITSTRAEFGLLCPVINELRKFESDSFKTELIVTGTHLYEEYGLTINEIRKQNIRIDEEIMIPVNSVDACDISKNQAEALVKFTKLFYKKRYSAILILGDRYEMLAVAIAAVNTKTPIFHISGGDISEGAIDDCIRHSITKMSYLHFPSNEESRKRIIQLGEAPERVFNFGSTSIDNIINSATLNKQEALDSVGVNADRYALCTYHPATLENESLEELVSNLLNALRLFPDIHFIITKANADEGGIIINKLLDSAEKEIPNISVFSSLGVNRYLSLMKYSEFVVGNSSSGIIETPAFHIPTVNIGIRQKGRLQTESIINCDTDTESIVNAIKKALSSDMKQKCKSVVSLYGDGTAAKRIADKCFEVVNKGNISLCKKFYVLS